MLNSKLGSENDPVLVLDLNDDSSRPEKNHIVLSALRDRIIHHDSIISMAASGSKYNQFSARILKNKLDERVIVGFNHVDPEYLQMFQIKLSSGDHLFDELSRSGADTFVVNETFVEQFDLDSPVGKKMSSVSTRFQEDSVIAGVAEDFFYTSLHNKIWPTYLEISKDKVFCYAYIKMREDNIQETLGFIRNEFKNIAPDLPFFYTFVEDEIAKEYENERQYGRMFGFVSFFAILIACSGLFGLMSVTVARRKREISIRKVLGASVPNIMTYVNKEYLTLVGLGNLFAWPLAYLAAEKWLQNFAYKITLTFDFFVFAGLIAFVIASTTIGFQSGKAAFVNPVDSLRHE
jgi:putative ABC transport system permease protein